MASSAAGPLKAIDPAWAWRPFEPRPGEWTRRHAAHLLRRAAFGGTAKQLEAAVEQGPASAVAQLLRGTPDAVDFRRQSDALAETVLATGDAQQLAAWWTYALLHAPKPLEERMTLLWHGHFATSADKVSDANLMWRQNQLLRRFALGDFRQLVHQVSRDPAMLIYLDSATNRKAWPNENYARELMELFCLGEGAYSEADVRQLARCFTGWEIKLGRFRFNRFQHDAGEKSILGKAGEFADGEAIDWILDQPGAATFIVGKLYRCFVCDEPDPSPELLEPLALELRSRNWEIGPVLERMLTSQLFYSSHAIGRKVRSPVDLAIGLLRALEGTTDAHQLSADLRQLGQGLFFPPSVKGWDGGRAWINSSTLLGRANMTARIVSDAKTRFGGGSLEEYFAAQGAENPDQVVEYLADVLLAVPLAPRVQGELAAVCRRNADRSRGIAETIHALATLPDFQLC